MEYFTGKVMYKGTEYFRWDDIYTLVIGGVYEVKDGYIYVTDTIRINWQFDCYSLGSNGFEIVSED